MITTELSFEQVKQIMENIDGTSLCDELYQQAPNIHILIDIMLKQLSAAMETTSSTIELPVLQGGDIRRLISIGINIPYYMVSEQYDNIDTFANAYVVMCSNYFKLKPCNYLPIEDVIENVSKVIQGKNSFTRLVIASNTLIQKMLQLSDVLDVADMGISQQFISTMLDEHIDELR